MFVRRVPSRASACTSSTIQRASSVSDSPSNTRTGAAEKLEPAVLQPVGVLELVDQDVLEALRIVLAQDFIPLQELVAAQQQLGKVDHALALALLVVGGIKVRHAPRVLVGDWHI